MIPQETKEFLSVPCRHPVAFLLSFLPAILSFLVGITIHRFSIAYLIPLVWCFFVSIFLVDGFKKGRIKDRQGSADLELSPKAYWKKFTAWSLFYVIAVCWSIGYAVQESKKDIPNQALTQCRQTPASFVSIP